MKWLLFVISIVSSSGAFALDELTFVSAPRGPADKETKIYQPIVDHLSKLTNVKIKYVHMKDWLSYRKAILENSYDIYFHGPHFASWQVMNQGHHFVARLSESHTFVVITQPDNARIQQLADLAGRTNCLHAEPNLGTLLFMSAFSNPMRQPVTVQVGLTQLGWKEAYEGVVSGRCVGAVIPKGILKQLNTNGEVRVVHQFPTVPNQAILAGPRVPSEIVDIMRTALVGPGGCGSSCAELFSTFASEGFKEVDDKDYASIHDVLRDDFLLGKKATTRMRQLARTSGDVVEPAPSAAGEETQIIRKVSTQK